MHQDYLECEETLDFGFSLLRDKQELKRRLDAAGTPGLISYIAALIRSGTESYRDIMNHVVDITGTHVAGPVEDLLMMGNGTHWVEIGNGIYQAPLHIRELR